MLWNTTVPYFNQRNNSSSVTYHFVREGVSVNGCSTDCIYTNSNLEDILTNNLPFGIDRY